MRALVFAWLCACLPLGASADEADAAGAHLRRGLQLYRAGDYAGAIVEFQAGYAIEPRAELLFAWAQAERKAGDCEAAADLYRRFIGTQPGARGEAAAATAMARCTPPSVEEGDASLSATVMPVFDPPPSPAIPPLVRERTNRDRLGLGLVGSGLVGMGAGATFYLVATSRENAVTHAATYDEYDTAVGQADAWRNAAIVTGAVGACVVTAGVVRLLLHKRKGPSVSVSPHGVAVGGTF